MSEENKQIITADDLGLTEKQRRFAEAYAVNFNGTKSCQMAGYNCSSESTAASMASQILGVPKVQRYIDQLTARRRQSGEVESQEIISELRGMAFGGVEKKISGNDKLKALELLGKTIGLFTDRHVVTSEPVIQMDQDELDAVLLEAKALKNAIGRGNTKLFIQPESEFDNE